MKIQFGLKEKDLSDFLSGENVGYNGVTLNTDNFIIIECEHTDIMITDKKACLLRRNIPEKDISKKEEKID